MTEEKLSQAAMLHERFNYIKRLFNAINNPPNETFRLVAKKPYLEDDDRIPMEFYGSLVVAIDKHIRSIEAEIEAL